MIFAFKAFNSCSVQSFSSSFGVAAHLLSSSLSEDGEEDEEDESITTVDLCSFFFHPGCVDAENLLFLDDEISPSSLGLLNLSFPFGDLDFSGNSLFEGDFDLSLDLLDMMCDDLSLLED